MRPRGTREVAIVFRDTVRESDLAWVRTHAPAGPHYRFRRMPGLLLYVPERALAALRANPRVRYVSAGLPITPTAETIGWNYQGEPQGHGFATLEWAASQGAEGTDGTDVGVAIIDSGVDCYNLANIDIYNACATGWSFTPYDANPYNDGYYNPQANVSGNHGTAVASLVIAARNNGIGIKGGAPGATIYPLKIFSSDPNDEVNCNRSAAAIDFATSSLSSQVAVMNLSYSGNSYLTYEGYLSYCQAERDAIYLATVTGRFIAASAGNESGAPVGWPARLPYVAAVAGLDCCIGAPYIWTGTSYGPEVSL